MTYHKTIQELTSLKEVEEYLNAMDYMEENRKSESCEHVAIVYSNGKLGSTKGGPVFGKRNEFNDPMYRQFIFEKDKELKLNNSFRDMSFVLCHHPVELHKKWKELYLIENPLSTEMSEEDRDVFWRVKELAEIFINEIIKTSESNVNSDKVEYLSDTHYLYNALLASFKHIKSTINEVWITKEVLREFHTNTNMIPPDLIHNPLFLQSEENKALIEEYEDKHKILDTFYLKYEHLTDL